MRYAGSILTHPPLDPGICTYGMRNLFNLPTAVATAETARYFNARVLFLLTDNAEFLTQCNGSSSHTVPVA